MSNLVPKMLCRVLLINYIRICMFFLVGVIFGVDLAKLSESGCHICNSLLMST